jgi:hypothetical protein
LVSVEVVITTDDKAFYEDMIEDQNALESTHQDLRKDSHTPNSKF